MLSWEEEAEIAAEFLQQRCFAARYGAALWCPDITAIFGNAAYNFASGFEGPSPYTWIENGKPHPAMITSPEDLREGVKKAQIEIAEILDFLQANDVFVLAWALSADRASWAVLTKAAEPKQMHEVVWACFVKSGQYAARFVSFLLTRELNSPVKTRCRKVA